MKASQACVGYDYQRGSSELGSSRASHCVEGRLYWHVFTPNDYGGENIVNNILTKQH